MALRDGYRLDQSFSGIRSGYVLDQNSSTLRAGYDNILSTGAAPLSLPAPSDRRGRVGAAIPSAGIALPAARGGTGPYAYSVTDLPQGLTASSANPPVITGSPTVPHVTRTVNYSVTDAASNTARQTFQFPIVDAGDEVTLDDWDNTGYGLNSLQPMILALFESASNVVGTESTVAIFARQNRGNVGNLLDADGNVTTDLSSLTLPDGGVVTPIINWVRLHPNNGRITLNQSGMDADGNATPEYAFSTHFVAGTVCYLQDKAGVVAIPRDNAGGGFMRFRPTAGANETESETLMARLDTDVHFILAIV